MAQKTKTVKLVEPQIQKIEESKKGLKRVVAVGRFSNETQYAKGVFYDKENDPIGKQALDVLSAKLAESNKFILLERVDIDQIEKELKLSNQNVMPTVGAEFLIIGSVTEYGRKVTGESNLSSRSKTQTVQVAVNLRLVDVSTGQVIYSEEGKGEAATTAKVSKFTGNGVVADYDATLDDKAISAAISQLVENIINRCSDKAWRAYFLSSDENTTIVSCGKSQGVSVGDIFNIIEKGQKVTNPQTGMQIELPGKIVGKIKIDVCGGDVPTNEWSIVSIIEGSIDKQNLTNYFIEEDKK
ncbi:MAG: CsgG/HfaB family protein [Bacteroidales bacterium]|nr:CsgG/HfaB family protein [Bacteroidales bacterium]